MATVSQYHGATVLRYCSIAALGAKYLTTTWDQTVVYGTVQYDDTVQYTSLMLNESWLIRIDMLRGTKGQNPL